MTTRRVVFTVSPELQKSIRFPNELSRKAIFFVCAGQLLVGASTLIRLVAAIAARHTSAIVFEASPHGRKLIVNTAQ